MLTARAHTTLRLLAILVIALAALVPAAERRSAGKAVAKTTTSEVRRQAQDASRSPSDGARGSTADARYVPAVARR